MRPALILAVVLGGLTLIAAGCKVGGLAVRVSNPTFGSVGIGLDGGVIGHGKLATNEPPALPPP